MNSNIRIYPSGFIGSATVPNYEEKQVIVQKQFMMLTSKEVTGETPTEYKANAEIVNLYNYLISDASNDFSFYTKVIEAALLAFGYLNFGEWIIKNYDTGLTVNHKKWIEETLDFIFNNEKRKVSNESWSVILKYDPLASTQNKEMLPLTHRIVNGELNFKRELDLDSLLWKWLSNEKGNDDLIASLHLLFGKH